MQKDMGRDSPQESMSVSEAAEFLGVTEDAVRKRIHRGKIRYERDDGGHYIVYPTQEDIRQTIRHTTDTNYVQSESRALTSALEARIESLERQLEEARDRERQANERDRENRRLLAAALERIPPQLEAGTETPPEAPERPSGGTQDTGEAPRPSLWRRLFGG